MNKKTCLHCGYTWQPRIETEPKACPRCKSQRWAEEPRKAGRPKNGLPKTKQRNLFPGDKTVVFLSDATDDSGVVWPKGSVKTPWSGGFSNEKNCKYQDFTDKTIFYEK
jgi:primosomal protein N'